MADGALELEKMGKAGTFGVVSGTDFAGQGAWVFFPEATVVTTWTAPKHEGAVLTGTWPANSWLRTPTTALVVSSGKAIVGKADI